MQQRLILSEPVGSLRAWVWTQVRTAQRAQLKIHKIQSLGGNIRGARRGVLRRRLVTVRLGRQGPRPPGTTTWVRGARCNRSGVNAGEASAAPEPKTATVERREASVPRYGTQGASQAPGTPRHGVPTGASHAPERLSALRPPLDSGERSKGDHSACDSTAEKEGYCAERYERKFS